MGATNKRFEISSLHIAQNAATLIDYSIITTDASGGDYDVTYTFKPKVVFIKRRDAADETPEVSISGRTVIFKSLAANGVYDVLVIGRPV